MFRFILAILLGTLCIIFFAQNTETVSIVFLFWTVTVQRALMLFFVLGAGFLIGWMLRGSGRKKKKH